MKTYIRWFNMTLIGTFLFVGLSLLGWGLGDWVGFLHNPARLSYVILVILLQGSVAAWIPDLLMGKGEGKNTVGRQKWAIVLLQVLSLSMVLVPPYCDHRGILVFPWEGISRYIGLGFFAFGFFLMNWAVAKLGKQFSMQVTIQEGHKLVTKGPFRYVRHPRYLGILLFSLGLSLIFRSWVGLLLTGAVKLVLLWRIKDEEALMAEEFKGKWQAYVARTWCLMPWVY